MVDMNAALSDSTTVTRMAAPPFDDGDVVLVSSDNVGFKIHRIILSIASPWFKSFFTIPQPVHGSTQHAKPADVPYIPVSEDSATLDHIFRLCYPITPRPVISTLAEVSKVLAAAAKYELTVVSEHALKRLEDFASADPLGVFVIACQRNLEEQACAAAKIWKARRAIVREDKTVWSQSSAAVACQREEMRHVSAGSFFRLLEFLRTGKLESICQPPTHQKPDEVKVDVDELYSCEDGDVVLRCSDGVDFPAHRVILGMAVPAILQLPSCPEQDRHIIQVGETSRVLAMFLALCVPFARRDLSSFTMAEDIWRMGTRLKSPRLCDIAKEYVAGRVVEDPLSSFFVASRCRWQNEAQDALRRCVAMDLTYRYSPEMEESTAEVYCCLLQCAHAYRESVHKACVVAQAYQNEGGDVVHLWSKGRNDSSANPIPTTLFAPIVERSLRYASQTKYTFDVRNVIEASDELGDDFERLLQKVMVDVRCMPSFVSSEGNDSPTTTAVPANMQ